MYQHKDIYTIDFTNVNYYLEIHNVIRRSLDFPDYYGCNWSAFWDCLTNMIGRPIHIEIIGLEVIEQKFNETAKTMLEILREFKHYDDDYYSNEIQIELVSEDIRINIE